MKPWHVYIVGCADGTLYCGSSNDVCKRVKQHNAGKGAKYTKGRAPVYLLWYSKGMTKQTALKTEARIKKLKRKEKQKLLDPYAVVRWTIHRSVLGLL